MPEPESIAQDGSQEDISKLVFMDDLTDIRNRRFMYLYLKEDVDWQAEQPSPLSMVMLDLDFFKETNDTYGHLAGDQLLVQTSAILKESFRDSDIVIRYAGDEFSILLPGTSRDEALKLAEGARQRFEQTDFQRGDETVKGAVTISAGVAHFPDDARTAEELVNSADKALYRSKSLGKNRVSDFLDVGKPAPGPTFEPAAAEPEADTEAPAPPPLPSLSQGPDVEAPTLPPQPPPAAPPVEAPPAPPVEAPPPAPPVVPQGHYRGDEVQIANMIRAASGVQSGRSSFILVKAGPNTGKIGILSEFMSRIEGKGARCIVETCSTQEMRMPYRPIFESLDRFLYKNVLEMDTIRNALSPDELGLLTREIPTLHRAFGDLPVNEEMTPLVKRYAYFDGTAKILAALSEKRVLCVVLDELQFVDEGTRNVIISVLRGGRGQIAFFGTLRPELDVPEDSAATTASRLVNDVREMELMLEITLQPLDAREVSKLLTELLPGRAPSDEFDRMMWQASKGNPLYIETAAQVLAAKGQLTFEDDKWTVGEVAPENLPGTLDELVHAQMELLDEQAENVVSNAAVIGSHFRLDVLSKMTGLGEAEILEILDRARELGILEFSERLSDDEMKFVSLQTHGAAYQDLDEEFVHKAHAQVAQVLQEIYKGHIDQIAPMVAGHYQRAGDEASAAKLEEMGRAWAERMFNPHEIEEYARKKAGKKRVKIDEFRNPLDERQTVAVMQVLQALSKASKNLNQYPEGSQLITQAIDQMEQAVTNALETLPGFTVGETKVGMLLNTRPVDPKAAGMTGRDITDAMRERSMQSFTFTRGTRNEELLAFARLFGMPPLKGTLSEDFWDENLRNADIEHIGVVQRTYVLDAQKARQTGMYQKRFLETLGDEAMAQACAAVRAMSTSMEKIVMYPPGSQLITTAVEQLANELQGLFTHCGGVSITTIEGNLLINGTEPGAQLLGGAGTGFTKSLDKGGVKSMLVSKEVTIEEMTDFLGLLGNTTEPRKNEEWKQLLAEKNITHIWAGQTIYAGSTLVMDTPQAAQKEKDDAPPANAEELIAKAQEMLGYDLPRLVAEDTVAAVPMILQAIVSKKNMDLFKKLADTYVGALSAEDDALRETAAAAAAQIYGGAAGTAGEALLALTRDGVTTAIRNEGAPGPFVHLLGVGSIVAARCIEKKDTEHLAAVAGAMRRDADAAPALAGPSAETLKKLAGSPGLKKLIEEADAEEAMSAMEAFGEAAVPLLVETIKTADSADAARRAAQAIHACGAKSEAVLLGELKADADATACRRILSVLDEMESNLTPALKRVVLHPDEKVLKEILPLLERIDAAVICEPLLNAARSADTSAATAAIQVLGGLACDAAVTGLCEVLVTAPDKDVKKAACIALGDIASPESVGTLKEVIQSKKLMGLSTAYPNDVRAAAVWALRAIPGDEVKALLERLTRDKNDDVKGAAFAALDERK